MAFENAGYTFITITHKYTMILFTQPLRWGRIWHKVNF